MKTHKLSIVIPTLNEGLNIEPLVERIAVSLAGCVSEYEVIFIDDHSTDHTVPEIARLAAFYPLRWYFKRGERGKAQSLLQGFEKARFDLVGILDADLQYPPEALPEMLARISGGSDVVVANRTQRRVSLLRKISSAAFWFFFAKLLHGFDCDVQAGLKVFRKEIIEEFDLHPTPWTFDLEFLIRARDYGYRITTVDVVFDERVAGNSKISLGEAIGEIGGNALKLKFRPRGLLPLKPTVKGTMRGAGIIKDRKRFVTHTTLAQEESAARTVTFWQKSILGLILAVGIFAFARDPQTMGIILVAVLSAVYFADVLFNAYVVTRSISRPPEIKFDAHELATVVEQSLPVYTILCPLYREAAVLPDFLAALTQLDWPKDKLDVLLLLEPDDQQTRQAVSELALPPFVGVIEVPDSQPKTKPKACNYGLHFARGEYLVVYDAEDRPDPLQLKKAYLGFQKAPPGVTCLQAKLNYYNPHQNLLTRLFTAEYSLWFDVILPGLQSINSAIPLGGTSNHFKTAELRALRGWDPFNVTEDCDLGIRLFTRGERTAIIDSVTLEEANSNLGNWLRQRSRWIKGYVQTYLVHTRSPGRIFRAAGLRGLTFHLVVGGKIAFLLVNPLLWLATFAYFALYGIVGSTIESLYPTAVFYMAATSLIFGNFLYLYYYMIGSAKREQWSIVKYIFLVPGYWLLASLAAYRALWQLLWKPHYWEKTIHGLHRASPAPAAVTSASPAAPPAASPANQKAWAGGVLLLAAMMASNFLNFVFNAFLGRALDFEDLALVTFINTIWYIATIFLGALSSTVNHKTAYLASAEGPAASAQFLKSTQRKSLLVAIGISAAWLVSARFLGQFFQISELSVLLLFTPALLVSVIGVTNRAYLHGNLFFTLVAALILSESVIKVISAGLLVAFGLSRLVYLSIPASIILSALISIKVTASKRLAHRQRSDSVFPGRFFGAALLSGVSATLFLSLDVLLVKHFLSPVLAGQYVLLSLVGKMIYFFGSLPSAFMITLISRQEGSRGATHQTFSLIFLASLLLVLGGALILGPLGSLTVPWLLGPKTLAIVPYLNAYSAAFGLFTLSTVIVVYHLSRKRYLFPIVSLVSSVVMSVGILAAHRGIEDIVNAIVGASAAGFVTLAVLHLLEPRLAYFKRAFTDFFGIWSLLPVNDARPTPSGKRILIFNWRDRRHLYAGGAEVYIHEIAKHWVAAGHRVTVFCGNDARSPRAEIVDGVEIVRRGGFYFVYIWAFVYYVFKFRGGYDLIIDCQNGIPFFTPLYARLPVFCLMFHVHQEVFRRSLSRPLAWFARFLEKEIMPKVYRCVRFITVSESSKKEMQALGLGQRGIEVVTPGVNLEILTPGVKSASPTVLYLGRLKAYKSVDILLHAFEILLRKARSARLVIAGSGEEDRALKVLAEQLGIAGRVEFAGQITEEQKVSFLQQAWVLVNPSMMEGWGITTIEANACATPVVAADVPGLRDSVRNPHTGYLVPYGDPQALASKLLQILGKKSLRQRMGAEAIAWAQNFDWKTSSQKFIQILDQVTRRHTGNYATEEI